MCLRGACLQVNLSLATFAMDGSLSLSSAVAANVQSRSLLEISTAQSAAGVDEQPETITADLIQIAVGPLTAPLRRFAAGTEVRVACLTPLRFCMSSMRTAGWV
jgi:hypothetical protein